MPGTFDTPALGLDFVILDESGKPAEQGELFLAPPSIGMSTPRLNRDHHEIYYEGRRSCDGPAGRDARRATATQMDRLPGGHSGRVFAGPTTR